MISLELAAIVGGAGVVVGGGLGGYLGYWYRGHRDKPEEFGARLNNMVGSGSEVVLPAPDVSSSLWGVFKQLRHKSKRKKLAKKGYVKWFKIDGMLNAPTWVKPERSGSGVPKFYDSDDDVHYLFPSDALVTDSTTGAPVAVHKSGEAEPVNLEDPEYPPIDADRLEELINLEIESEPPSWLSKFDLNAQTLMWAMIFIVLIFAGAQQLL